MVRWFALTLLAVLLAAALPPSPGVAQDGAPASATTAAAPPAAAAAATAASESARVKAADEAIAKQDEADAAKAPDVGRMATLLAGVFALAAIIEAALAVIFTWPVFLDRINRRNSKMPIALLVCWVVAWGFDLRLIHKLAAAFGAGSGDHLPLWFDGLLSALILAGGAAGVRGLMVALGLASPAAEVDRPPLPPRDKAWLSVRDGREQSEKSSDLSIWLGTENAEKVVIPRLVGVIPRHGIVRAGWARLFLTDRSRFPQVAGYAVAVGVAYMIYAVDSDSPPLTTAPWRKVTFGEGAIIDLVYRKT